jgi:hypothetical protein
VCVNVASQEGSTAFMLSVIHNRMSVSSLLLEAGANVNEANHVRSSVALFHVTVLGPVCVSSSPPPIHSTDTRR